jgi:hypothetical protein
MTIPTPWEEISIVRILPVLQEMIAYACMGAVKQNRLSYDSSTDELTYHFVVGEIDRDLFDLLKGTDEVWIITEAGTES